MSITNLFRRNHTEHPVQSCPPCAARGGQPQQGEPGHWYWCLSCGDEWALPARECGTFGALLDDIAYQLSNGETSNALNRLRQASDDYRNVPLPDGEGGGQP